MTMFHNTPLWWNNNYQVAPTGALITEDATQYLITEDETQYLVEG